MDLNVCLSVLSVICSWLFCTVLSAPAAETSTSTSTPTSSSTPSSTPGTPAASTHPQRRHARAKRCSCATFMDKECVYFCHLDIIWVNTPERVVSYGLGNAPRTRRALRDSKAAASGGARCACVREDDPACRSFCGIRVRRSRPPAVLKSRLLLEERRGRRRRRVRAWGGQSAAS